MVRELQRYEYFGEVSAVKIAELRQHDSVSSHDGGSWLVVPDGGGEAIEVPYTYVITQKPEVGGYYVVWPNGFAGYMADDAFANCYRPIAPAKMQSTGRDARELALKYCAPELYGSAVQHLRAIDAVARYIETGEMPTAEDQAA